MMRAFQLIIDTIVHTLLALGFAGALLASFNNVAQAQGTPTPPAVAAVTQPPPATPVSAAPKDIDERGHFHRPRGVTLAPLFQLATHDGKPFSRADVRGRPFAVFFGFTNCPEVCPTTLLEMSNHLAALGPDGDRLKVIFVSVDPERDTPEHMRKYLGSFDPRIVGLTGSPVEVAAVAQAFRASYEKVPGRDGAYTMNHSLMVYLVDRYGLLAAALDYRGKETDQRALLKRLLAQ
jgi:protein SCO1/2